MNRSRTLWLGAALGVGLLAAGCGEGASSGADDTRVDPTDQTDTSADDTGDGVVAADSALDDTVIPELAEPPALVDPVLIQPAGTTGTIRVQPALAIDNAGRVAIAFTGQDDDRTGIFLTLYDATDGMTEVVPAFLANTDNRGLRNEPTVCALSGGGFVLGWSVDTQTSGADGENNEVRFRRFNADGGAFDLADRRIYTERPGNHWLLDLACGGDGGFVAAGVRPSAVTPGFEVFTQRYDAAGVEVGAAVEIAPGAAAQIFPRVAMATSGSYVVAWEDLETLDDHARTLARVVGGGDGTDLIVTVSGDEIAPSMGAVVAADPDGTFVVGGFRGGLQIQHLSGTTLTPMTWPEVGATAVTQGALVGVGGDRFAAVYYTGNGDNTRARLAYFDGATAAGDAVTADTGRFLVPYQPAIAYANGRLVAAWTESLGSSEFTIHLARFAD